MLASASEPQLAAQQPGEGWFAGKAERRKSKCVCGEDFEALAKEHGVDVTRNRKSILAQPDSIQGLQKLQAMARGSLLEAESDPEAETETRVCVALAELLETRGAFARARHGGGGAAAAGNGRTWAGEIPEATLARGRRPKIKRAALSGVRGIRDPRLLLRRRSGKSRRSRSSPTCAPSPRRAAGCSRQSTTSTSSRTGRASTASKAGAASTSTARPRRTRTSTGRR